MTDFQARAAHYEANWNNAEQVITLWKNLGKLMAEHLNNCSDTWTPDSPLLDAIYQLAPELRERER
jgi:hypothetical protein